MSELPFHKFLESVRSTSTWPTIADFARQVGLSHSGFKKYERGDRLPSKEALEKIIHRGMLGEPTAQMLYKLWNQTRAEQVGVVVEEPVGTNSDTFAARVHSEVLYVLKQEGIQIKHKTTQVLAARIRMITSAVSEKK